MAAPTVAASEVAASARAPATAVARAFVVGAWLAFVWASTHWYSWQQTVDLLFGSDMREYERVARAAPGLPTVALPSQHADRFVPHYLVGVVSDALGVGDRVVYYVAAIVLLLALAVAVDRAIAPLGLGLGAYALCQGALIGNPYLFRFLAVAPARLGDSVFALGAVLAVHGLLRGRAWLVPAGLVVATLGRSESVLALAVLAPVGVATAPALRARTSRARVGTALAAVAAPALAYALVRVVDRSFSVADHPGLLGLTLLGTLRHLPRSAHELAVHLARTLVGIAGALALAVGIALRARPRRLAAAFWIPLVAGLAVVLEGFLLNPTWLEGSEPLLAAVGSPCLVVAVAVLAAAVDLSPSPAELALAAGALALLSLHHVYGAISPAVSAGTYALLAAGSAVVAAVALADPGRRRRASS